MVLQQLKNYKWMLVALFILLGNVIVYQMPFIHTLTDEQIKGMVVGSLIDCAIVAPALLLYHQRKLNIKYVLIFVSAGILFARIIIPSSFMGSFKYVTWAAIGVEASFVFIELFLIFLFIRYFPSIVRKVKLSHETLLFAFPAEVDKKCNGNPIIRVLSSEMLMFYYAFLSWGKKVEKNSITLYKNTMYIPVLIMVFHAAIFEAVGFHILFHERFPILAWGHTILSVYGLIFLIADFQALRHNPVKIHRNRLYLSNGLLKRASIKMEDIQTIHEQLDNDEIYHFKALGNTDEKPAFVIEMVDEQIIQMAFGLEKKAKFIGIYVDNPLKLKADLKELMGE